MEEAIFKVLDDMPGHGFLGKVVKIDVEESSCVLHEE